MMGMINWIVLIYLLWIVAIVGFAYVILIMARKEVGITKLAGQIIALSIVILALIVLLMAGLSGNQMKQNMCGMMNMKMDMGKMMMGQNHDMRGMMKHKMMGDKKMMGQMMKNMSKEDMKKCLEEHTKNNK